MSCRDENFEMFKILITTKFSDWVVNNAQTVREFVGTMRQDACQCELCHDFYELLRIVYEQLTSGSRAVHGELTGSSRIVDAVQEQFDRWSCNVTTHHSIYHQRRDKLYHIYNIPKQSRHGEESTGQRQRPMRGISPPVLHIKCRYYLGDTTGSTEKPETAIERWRCYQTAVEADMGVQKINPLVLLDRRCWVEAGELVKENPQLYNKKHKDWFNVESARHRPNCANSSCQCVNSSWTVRVNVDTDGHAFVNSSWTMHEQYGSLPVRAPAWHDLTRQNCDQKNVVQVFSMSVNNTTCILKTL